MIKEIEILGNTIPVWIALPVFFLLWVVIGMVAKKILFPILNFLAKKTSWKFDDLFLESLEIPFIIMVFVTGAVVAIEILTLHGEKGALTKYSIVCLKAGTIIAIVVFIDQFLSKLIETYSPKVELLRISKSLASGLVHGLVIVIGGLILLDSLGVSITPIIASLGIGSLAVALALQPTLENLFSGFQIILDRPIMPGQFIKLNTGEEGFVERVGWRSTWIRQLPNNMIVIPNKELVNSRVLNYHYPSAEQGVTVEVGVHYNSDLKKVERLVEDVGGHIMKTVKGGVPEFLPVVRYHSFGDSSINFTAVLRVKDVVDGSLVKHEFIKLLAERFSKEGIVIPYPVRAINTEQEKAVLNGMKAN